MVFYGRMLHAHSQNIVLMYTFEAEKRLCSNVVCCYSLLTQPVMLYSQVIADSLSGLLFKNKRDRKIVCVDPKVGVYYTHARKIWKHLKKNLFVPMARA